MMPDAVTVDLRKQLEFSERRRLRLTRFRKRSGGEEEGLLWSIADLMTLLVIFFVILNGQGALGSPAGEDLPSPTAIIAAPLPQSRPEPLPELPPLAPAPSPDLPDLADTVAIDQSEMPLWVPRLEAEVARLLDGHGASQAFAVRWDARRPVIVLGEQITFNEGKADLLTPFLPVLSAVAQLLNEETAYHVRVAGHTDNTPIRTALFPSNWELSTARAVNVARFLIQQGVAPERLAVEGFAEYVPLEPNLTADQRQRNRRVEITLLGQEEPQGAEAL